jgi:hypothetical protein
MIAGGVGVAVQHNDVVVVGLVVVPCMPGRTCRRHSLYDECVHTSFQSCHLEYFSCFTGGSVCSQFQTSDR